MWFFFIFEKKDMECLDKIIGVTNIDCDCIHAGLSEDKLLELKESESGIYLDDVEGGVYLHTVKQIDKCIDFADIQLSAIATATKHLKSDLSNKLFAKHRKNAQGFSGAIGQSTFTGALGNPSQIHWLKISANNANTSLVFKPNNIRFVGSKTGTVTFKIIKQIAGESFGEVLHEETSEITGNKYFHLSPPSKTFPFTVNGEKVNYYFTMENNEGIVPRNNKQKCNCPRGNNWRDLTTLSGGSSQNYANIYESNSNDSYMHGFALDGRISCEVNGIICEKYNSENHTALVLAWALAYKANELVIENIVNSNEVSRFTLMRREVLYGKRNHFRKEYNDRVDFLIETIDLADIDCFVCKNDKMYFGGILS